MAKTKVICFANNKGGSGKSTTCSNVGYGLSVLGSKVLLIDGDMQMNLSLSLFDEDQVLSYAQSGKNLYEGIRRQDDLTDYIDHSRYEGLDLIPSSTLMSSIEYELFTKWQREYILRKCLANIVESEMYDYILIDCPPSLGIITTNALCVADTLLVPIQCEYYALEGLSQLMNSVRRVKRQYNEQLDIEGVLLTMYDGRLNLTQQVVEEVKKYFPRKVFATVIPRTVRLSEAPSFGRPICYFDRSSKGAYAYDALADEVLKKAAP